MSPDPKPLLYSSMTWLLSVRMLRAQSQRRECKFPGHLCSQSSPGPRAHVSKTQGKSSLLSKSSWCRAEFADPWLPDQADLCSQLSSSAPDLGLGHPVSAPGCCQPRVSCTSLRPAEGRAECVLRSEQDKPKGARALHTPVTGSSTIQGQSPGAGRRRGSSWAGRGAHSRLSIACPRLRLPHRHPLFSETPPSVTHAFTRTRAPLPGTPSPSSSRQKCFLPLKSTGSTFAHSLRRHWAPAVCSTPRSEYHWLSPCSASRRRVGPEHGGGGFVEEVMGAEGGEVCDLRLEGEE